MSIRIKVAGVDLLIIVETKNLGRPAEIGEVDESASKVADVRAEKGVLICSGGFTAGAQAVALARGLELCRLHDASTRDLNLDVKLPMLRVDLISSVQMSAETRFLGGDQVEKNFLDNVFLTAEGTGQGQRSTLRGQPGPLTADGGVEWSGTSATVGAGAAPRRP